MNLPPNTAMSRGLGRGKKRTEGEGRGMAPQLVRINFRVELNYMYIITICTFFDRKRFLRSPKYFILFR